MKKRKTTTGTKLKYIIPILIAVVLIYIFVSMLTSSFSMVYVEPAQYETVSKTVSSEAYIFRKESYIANDNGGVLYYNISDCSSVALGGTIASLYETETDAINVTQLKTLNEEIDNLTKLNAMSQVTDTSLESINTSLNDQLTEFIIDIQNNNFTESDTSMESLLYSLNAKQITTGEAKDFNARLLDLQTERDALLQTTKPAFAEIVAPKAGVFTSQTDGCETLLNIQKFQVLHTVSF